MFGAEAGDAAAGADATIAIGSLRLKEKERIEFDQITYAAAWRWLSWGRVDSCMHACTTRLPGCLAAGASRSAR